MFRLSFCCFSTAEGAVVIRMLRNSESFWSPVHTASDTQQQSDKIPFISMERWRHPATQATLTVGDRMWACQATRDKRQKLRIFNGSLISLITACFRPRNVNNFENAQAQLISPQF